MALEWRCSRVCSMNEIITSIVISFSGGIAERSSNIWLQTDSEPFLEWLRLPHRLQRNNEVRRLFLKLATILTFSLICKVRGSPNAFCQEWANSYIPQGDIQSAGDANFTPSSSPECDRDMLGVTKTTKRRILWTYTRQEVQAFVLRKIDSVETCWHLPHP